MPSEVAENSERERVRERGREKWREGGKDTAGSVTADWGNQWQLHTERASVPQEDLQRAVLNIPAQTDVCASRLLFTHR